MGPEVGKGPRTENGYPQGVCWRLSVVRVSCGRRSTVKEQRFLTGAVHLKTMYKNKDVP